MVTKKDKWVKVVFAADCLYEEWDTEHECATCPVCLEPYADCPCPGPMQEYDYKEVKGVLYAKKKL